MLICGMIILELNTMIEFGVLLNRESSENLELSSQL